METLSVLQKFDNGALGGSNYVQMAWRRSNVNVAFLAHNDRVSSRFSDGRCPESDDCHRSITNDLHGCFSPGGSMPAEPSIAAAIAVPVALLGNLKPEAAIAVAVPVGLLGSYLYQFRFFINTF